MRKIALKFVHIESCVVTLQLCTHLISENDILPSIPASHNCLSNNESLCLRFPPCGVASRLARCQHKCSSFFRTVATSSSTLHERTATRSTDAAEFASAQQQRVAFRAVRSRGVRADSQQQRQCCSQHTADCASAAAAAGGM